MHQIFAPRLVLKLMSEEFLEASLNDETQKAEAMIGLKIPAEWYHEKDHMAMRLDDCRSDPEYVPWSARAIGLASTGTMVGRIGFHTRPDAEYLRQFVPDGVELGYSVFPQYRRNGYALEAIRGLMGWAASQHDVRHFVASISPTNLPSLTLARKLGFVKVGEHLDDVDGLEEVFALSGDALADFLEDTPLAH